MNRIDPRLAFRFWLVAIILSLPGMARAQACDRSGDVAITNVAVVRPETGRIDPDQTVIARCGRILAIGPSSLVRPRAGFAIVPGRSRFLVPGLVDAHGHGTETGWYRSLYLAFGVLAVRNPGGSSEALEAREATRAGRTIGPVVYLAGPPVRGDEPEWGAGDPAQAARAIANAARLAGYDYIKTYYQLRPDQFSALADAAEAERLPLIGHVPRSLTPAAALDRLWSVEHLTGFDDALEDPSRHVTGPGSAMLTLRRFAVARDERIDMLAREVARRGVWQVPTLLTYDIWAHPDRMREMAGSRDILQLVGRQTVARWIAPNRWYVTPPDQQTDADRAAIAAAVSTRARIVRALYDAGARLAIGTDAGEVFVAPGLSLHGEMRLYEEAGIPRAAILRMATIEGARLIGDEADFGTIAVGKRADMLLVDRNPLEALAALERPAAVFVGGHYLDRRALDDLLAGVRAQHEAGEAPGRAGGRF